MAHCGLCLGPLRFRLQCVLLHEGGLWIMKWLLLRWGAGLLHVLRPALLPLLLTFFPARLPTFSHLRTPHLGKKEVFMVSGISVSLLLELRGYSESPKDTKDDTLELDWQLPVGWAGGCFPYQQRTSSLTGHIRDYFLRLLKSGINIMDVLALEAKNVGGAEPEKKPTPRPKPKPPKKAKRIVYFEVEIVDLKTKEKLLLLDKVSVCVCWMEGFWLLSPFILIIMVLEDSL